jgi:adenosylcobinamide kinase/adenosylcobinamide-phosphate guanylyltransferase
VPNLILITGGARSGKSDFAEKLAGELGGDDVLFVATAEARDDEMAQRIAAHRLTRPATWRTLEAAWEVGLRIRSMAAARVILLDCLTLLISNTLDRCGENAPDEITQAAVEMEVRALLGTVSGTSSTMIVVTNEVGLGIVPMNRLARQFRDLLGRANATLAKAADQVFLLVSGLPIDIKALASGVRPR